MDKDKVKKFIFTAIVSGYDEDSIVDYLRNKLPTGAQKEIAPTTPAPIPPGGPTSAFASALELIQKYFPANQVGNALAIARGESGFNPAAVGDKYPIGGIYAPSYGLFQIRGLPGRPSAEQLLNPEFNVQYAANLYRQQGWRPWYNTAKKLGLLD